MCPSLSPGGEGRGEGGPIITPASAVTLTPKVKQIHDQGLVSVLKQLHDDLDAAVFDAYGWPPTLTGAGILERVVALNAERAGEEVGGKIRRLRPEYQNKSQKPEDGRQEEQSALDLSPAKAKPRKSPTARQKLTWPKTLAERVKAVADVLGAAPQALTSPDVAARFRRAKPPEVREILETLCVMGQARHGRDRNTYLS